MLSATAFGVFAAASVLFLLAAQGVMAYRSNAPAWSRCAAVYLLCLAPPPVGGVAAWIGAALILEAVARG